MLLMLILKPLNDNVALMNTCCFLPLLSQDQYDVIDKHTQCGLDLVERYIKFVKERTEIEQSYAKQLRCVLLLCGLVVVVVVHFIYSHVYSLNRSLTKKYAKRGSKEEQDCK